MQSEPPAKDAHRMDDEVDNLALQVRNLKRQIDKMRNALDNCRLFASKNRAQPWATSILRFCAEGGSVPATLRDELTDD